MADLKISQLSSATALAGTEVVPVVQGGVTKKATIDQILAPAAGKGIDFTANGGDVLKDYDEGTWSPTAADFVNLTAATVSKATFTKIGRQITMQLKGTMAVTAPLTVTSMSLTLPENQGDLDDPALGIAQFDYTGVGACTDYTGSTGNTIYVFFPANQVSGSGTRGFQVSMTYNAAS
jgi:hypothetical protein